jgi:hypothetical protein
MWVWVRSKVREHAAPYDIARIHADVKTEQRISFTCNVCRHITNISENFLLDPRKEFPINLIYTLNYVVI